MIGFIEHSQIITTSNCSAVTPCSAGPPFLVSPRQIENEFLSTQFSVWGTGKSHGAKSGELGGRCLSTGMHFLAKNCFTARVL
jgi:hypothetical protein